MKNKEIKATWSIRISTPRVPNFVFEMGKKDNEGGKYPISDFPDSVLEEIGKQWTENLKARAAEMRKMGSDRYVEALSQYREAIKEK